MEGVGSEVSLKIRSAIKAKLVELGTYVDEELPDYIMVLVANKKTKDQMDDDLSLFLGHNTERFTSWLHHVLQKLNAAALLQVTTPPPDEPKKKETEEDKKKLKEEEKRREKDEAKKREKAEEMKKVKDEEKKKIKEKDKIEKKKKLDRKEKNLKVESTEEEIVEKGKKSKDREKEGKEKVKISIEENDAGDANGIEGVDGVQAATKKMKPLVRGKVSSADIFRAEAADGKEEPEEEIVEDMLELRAEVDELGLELEEDSAPKKAKLDQRKKIVPPRTSSREDINVELKIESKIESKVKKSKRSSPSSRVSAKERLGRVVSSKSDHPKEKPSVLDRLGSSNSSSRRIINLREESSFPPRPESFSNGSSSGLARAVSSAISSAQRSVCVLPSSSSSGKKLEARVRPLMSKHVESSRDEHSREGSSRSSTGRVVSAVGAVLKRPYKEVESDEEEYDPKKPMLSSMASKVEVIPRPRRSGAIQANKALILRAMADAHKSVNKPSRRRAEKSESPKKKQKGELYTRSYREREQARHKELPEKDEIKLRKIAITVPNATRKESEKQQQEENIIMSEIGSIMTKPVETRKLERPIPMTEEYEIIGTVADDGYEVEEMESLEGELDDGMGEPSLQLPHHKVPLIAGDKTKFIVTLEGLDAEGYQVRPERPDIRSRLGARPLHNDSLEEVEEYIEEVEEWEEMEDTETEANQDLTAVGDVSVTSKPKLKNAITALPMTETGTKKPEKERCKFWPGCKSGDTCPYHHPSVACTIFPNCKFGDKCLFIHPKCMYDSACTRIGCPYSHTSARGPALIAASMKHKLVAPTRPAKIRCKFFPKCTNMTCPFLHPKACFYGTSCINQATCPYSHPEIPTGAKLKWIAPKTSPPKIPVPALEEKEKEEVPIKE